ncbi:MAG: DUF1330 domain-containing protein [Rhodospirillaceae bacterium]
MTTRGYSIAFARDMIPEKMKPYSSSLPPIYEKYQGKYLAIGGPGRGVEWLCGDWDKRMVMVGEFPTLKAVGAFWWGPEYRASAKLREGAVKVDVGQVAGTKQAPLPEHKVFLLIAVPAASPIAVVGGDTIISVRPESVTVLEGDLSGLALTMVGFHTREALMDAWEQVSERVVDLGGHACAANRAPSK